MYCYPKTMHWSQRCCHFSKCHWTSFQVIHLSVSSFPVWFHLSHGIYNPLSAVFSRENVKKSNTKPDQVWNSTRNFYQLKIRKLWITNTLKLHECINALWKWQPYRPLFITFISNFFLLVILKCLSKTSSLLSNGINSKWTIP